MTQLPTTTATGRGHLRRFADTDVYVYLHPDKPGNGVSRPALDRLLRDGLVQLGEHWPTQGRLVSVTTMGRAVLAVEQDAAPAPAASPSVRLRCLDATHAAAVVTEATRPGDTTHTVAQDGEYVVIGFHDPRWPMDVAEWAHTDGHAHDDAAARCIAAVADLVEHAKQEGRR